MIQAKNYIQDVFKFAEVVQKTLSMLLFLDMV